MAISSTTRLGMRLKRRQFIQSSVGVIAAGLSLGLRADSEDADTHISHVATCTQVTEPVIDPGLPIIDPHHHLWLIPQSSVSAMLGDASLFGHGLGEIARTHGRYLFDDFQVDAKSGHNILGTVFMEAGAFYRTTGPPEMRSIGEVEFANGVAAMAASQLFGKIEVCSGIVGNADLSIGAPVEEVLQAHMRAAGGRYRGVRNGTCYDSDPMILGGGRPLILRDRKFREGFSYLRKLGFSFDAYVLEPQLPEIIDLARAFPDTQIILNHLGTPVCVAKYAGKRKERFALWRSNIRELAKCSNVAIKLGGLATPLLGLSSWLATPSFTSEQLAAEWGPYITAAIEAFGADRCMFESDYPVASGSASYVVVWNTYKRIVSGASADEKARLFSGTARRIYKLSI